MSAIETLQSVDPITPMDAQGSSLDRYLGNTIRQLRLENGLTIAEISERAGISRGMLSKIENGVTSPSLETLEQLANSLGVTISRLFRGYKLPPNGAQLVKKGQGLEVVRRGTKIGHTYHLLAYDQGPQKSFEPFLITLEEQGEEFPAFEHPGTEFLHMLEGEMEYRVGDEIFLMQQGDSLTFRGETPHRPEKPHQLPIRFLSVIHYDSANKQEIAEESVTRK